MPAIGGTFRGWFILKHTEQPSSLVISFSHQPLRGWATEPQSFLKRLQPKVYLDTYTTAKDLRVRNRDAKDSAPAESARAESLGCSMPVLALRCLRTADPI